MITKKEVEVNIKDCKSYLIISKDNKFKAKEIGFDCNIFCLCKFFYKAIIDPEIIDELYDFDKQILAISFKERFSDWECVLSNEINCTIVHSFTVDNSFNDEYTDIGDILDKIIDKESRIVVVDDGMIYFYYYNTLDNYNLNGLYYKDINDKKFIVVNEELINSAYSVYNDGIII